MKNQKLKIKNKKCTNLFAQFCAGIFIMLSPVHSFAQADIHFSQFYETSILRNPALTGVFEDDYKLGVYYRNQWSSITNPYTTTLFSAETHFAISERSDDFVSFGLLGYSDKAGSVDQKITGIYPAVNYNKAINPNHNTYLSVGFTGGYLQYSFDPSKATFNNQYLNGSYNPANPSLENIPYSKFAVWDAGAGVNYNTSTGPNNSVSYIVGVSAYHFSQPILSYYKNPDITENIRWNGNAALTGIMTDQLSIQIQTNYALQGTYQEVMVGGLVNYTAIAEGPNNIFAVSAGAFLRYGDAIIPVVKVKYQNMSVGISYDVNLSSLKDASNFQGGTEVTLFITGNYTDKSVAKKTVCPKF